MLEAVAEEARVQLPKALIEQEADSMLKDCDAIIGGFAGKSPLGVMKERFIRAHFRG